MTEPNPRRQQPPQNRRDVAVADDGGQQLSPMERMRERRRVQIAQVAQHVGGARADFERLLPEHISLATFMGGVGAALHKSEKLMQGAVHDPDALLIACREAAMLGHVPGTDHYWLTPRKAKGNPSILGIEGYQGIVERMYRSGGVLSVHAEIARQHDVFEPYAGPNGRPLHQFGGKLGAFSTREERGPVIGTYAYAILPGGVPSQLILLSLEDLMEIKAANPFSNDESSPWRKWPLRMYLKSGLRRLEPYVPVSAGYRQTMAQAQAFVAAAALTAPDARAIEPRMEDTVGAGEALEGDVEDGPKQHAAASEPDDDRPVAEPYNPQDWGGDWDSLSVTRPGQGVPPEVQGNG